MRTTGPAGPAGRGAHPALVAVALLLGLAVVSVAAARVTGLGRPAEPAPVSAPAGATEAEPVQTRALRFADRPDGAVVVTDADSGELVRVLEPGSHGFARGVLRGLSRERKRRGIPRDTAYRLLRFGDGRVSLEDPSTDQRVELLAFGSTNAAAFAQLLDAEGEPNASRRNP